MVKLSFAPHRTNRHLKPQFALLLSPFLALTFHLFPPSSNQFGDRTLLNWSRSGFINRQWVTQLAQTQPLLMPSRDGNQIVLNNRTLNIPWNQSQGTIAIADVFLARFLGLQLLNTSNLDRQPVQWFSTSATPLNLPTRLSNPHRHLDITALSQRFGWDVSVSGQTLRINTPAAAVNGIRQGRQPWGDRIVIDLNAPTPYQMTFQGGEFRVTLDASIDPAIVQAFKPSPGNRLTSLSLEANARQTIVRIGVPAGLRPQLSTLANPSRLIIDVRTDAIAERNIQWASGLRWQQRSVPTSGGSFIVHSLTLDPRQTDLALRPILANSNGAPGIAPLTTFAQQSQAVAAINGGFFNRNNQLPLGAVRQNGRWRSGPILNRGAFAWNSASDTLFTRVTLSESVTAATGKTFALTTLNSGLVRAGLARFTTEWGTSYTNLTDYELVMTIQGDRVVSHRPSALGGQTTFPIPADGYLLVARSLNSAAGDLPVGSTIRLSTASQPAEVDRFSNVIAAGPLLLQNRQIVLNPQAEQFSPAFIREAAPRSAIGRDAQGNLILVAVQNRLDGVEPTLPDIAQIMLRLNAIDAVNLDGGSSTSLYLGGQLINREPQTAARVHNAIGVFIVKSP